MATDKSWLKNNIFAVAAVLLPLLIVAVFSLATLLPRLWVDDPRFDLLFAVATVNEPYGRSYEVRDDRIVAIVSYYGDRRLHQSSRLYRYHAATGNVSQVSCPAESITGAALDSAVIAEKREDAEFYIETPCQTGSITGQVAPDGYQVRANDYRGAGLFGELFGMRSRRNALAIEKSGRVIAVEHPENGEYYYYLPVVILGWTDPAESDS